MKHIIITLIVFVFPWHAFAQEISKLFPDYNFLQLIVGPIINITKNDSNTIDYRSKILKRFRTTERDYSLLRNDSSISYSRSNVVKKIRNLIRDNDYYSFLRYASSVFKLFTIVQDYYFLYNHDLSELYDISELDFVKEQLLQDPRSDTYDWYLYYYLSAWLNERQNNIIIASENYRNALIKLNEIEGDGLEKHNIINCISTLGVRCFYEKDYFFYDNDNAERLMKYIKNGIVYNYDKEVESDLSESDSNYYFDCYKISVSILYLDKNLYEYAMVLEKVRDLYIADENIDKALESNMCLCEIYKYLIKSWLMFSSFHRIDNFKDSYSQVMTNMTSLTIKANHPKDYFTTNSYNALLINKGFLLAAEKSMADIINTKGDSIAINMYKKRDSLQNYLKKLKLIQEENEEQIIKATKSLYSIERKLAVIAQKYGYLDFLSLKYDDIRQNLREKEYIVDCSDFYTEDGVHQYVAYIFNKDDECPHLIKVFTKEEWKSITMGKPSYEIYKKPLSDDVIDLIWKPICGLIPEGSTVYFVPSGVLHQVALESLPIDGNYKFIRLSSAREVIERKDSIAVNGSARSNAVLYGGLQYIADLPEMKAEASKYENQSFAVTRGKLSVNGNDEWQPLKWSAVEVDSVGKILQDNHVNTIPFKGLKGIEESFLDMHNRAPQILLLSTHGFYYNPEEADKIDYLRGYTDAMSLSGLILSGANYAWKGNKLSDGVLPGILTADKIAQLNLDGLDLVVLSACHTADGKVTPEGIYGLQRAFKKAGAGTIVMTLWDVNDEVTKDFIIQFFKNLVSNGWNKREAFDAAKETIRSRNEDFPRLWAGFVMLD